MVPEANAGLCVRLRPSLVMSGNDRDEAMVVLAQLEIATQP